MGKRSPRRGAYGNNATYLVDRIARDRPDILERMKAGEYNHVRQAAIDAGIAFARRPYAGLHPDDVPLAKLMEAWAHAPLETRQLFLEIMDDEINAAYEGRLLNGADLRKGPAPWGPVDGAAIPEIEAAIDAGATVNDVARRLQVSPRTLRRWRAGTAKPNQEARRRIAALAAPTP